MAPRGHSGFWLLVASHETWFHVGQPALVFFIVVVNLINLFILFVLVFVVLFVCG